MAKKRTSDAVRILYRKYYEGRPDRMAELEDARASAEVARKIYRLRTSAGLTQKQLADHIGCDVKVINRIVNDRSSVTAEMALKLAAAFKTSPQFWLNAQLAVDIYRASKKLKKVPKPLPLAG